MYNLEVIFYLKIFFKISQSIAISSFTL